VDDGADAQAAAATAYGQLPLSFEANQGQADPAVDFVAHGQGYSLSLTAGDVFLNLRQPSTAAVAGGRDSAAVDQGPTVLGIQLQGADPHPRATGEEPLPGTANYFIGNDPSQWQTGIPTYARVRYRDVYPGIDLVYYGHQGHLEDDFVVAPGAEPGVVRLAFTGADGLEVDATGAPLVSMAGGQVRLQPPSVYQDTLRRRQSISAAYLLGDDQHVGFQVAAYDPTGPLVIDPVLVYSTLLGSSSFSFEQGRGIAVDAAGNAYLTGFTQSADFPTTPGAFQTTLRLTHPGSEGNAFVTTLNATGTALVYSTYLGGGGDSGSAIAVDQVGDAYVIGSAGSADFPTTLALSSGSRQPPLATWTRS
jgi:hypothetical protein